MVLIFTLTALCSGGVTVLMMLNHWRINPRLRGVVDASIVLNGYICVISLGLLAGLLLGYCQ